MNKFKFLGWEAWFEIPQETNEQPNKKKVN